MPPLSTSPRYISVLISNSLNSHVVEGSSPIHDSKFKQPRLGWYGQHASWIEWVVYIGYETRAVVDTGLSTYHEIIAVVESIMREV